jgi:hypothetical protein
MYNLCLLYQWSDEARGIPMSVAAHGSPAASLQNKEILL